MRASVLVLAVLVWLSPSVVNAQPPGKVWTIGYLSPSTAEFDRDWVTAFRQKLRELGYVEGKDAILEQRHAGGGVAQLADLAAQLVRLKADVVVVYGNLAAATVRKVTSTVPIVMAVSGDPVGNGLIASMARPGGNITGLSDAHTDLVPKRLQLLKEAVPPLSRVAVLFDPRNPASVYQMKSAHASARRLGLTVLDWESRGAADLDRSFTVVAKQRPDAILIIPGPTLLVIDALPALALKTRLPAMGTVKAFADAGMLLSYGTNFAELWRRAAVYVDKIIKGANPGALPVEEPTKFDLVVNLRTAAALGITIPPSLLLRADHVIK